MSQSPAGGEQEQTENERLWAKNLGIQTPKTPPFLPARF